MAEAASVVIDSHQHVWDPERAEYRWLEGESAILNRRIDFDEVVPALRRAGVQASVLVESADNDDDTRLMFETADAHPEVVGIVAYAPLDRPTVATRRLRELGIDRRLVGVRNLIHNNPDPDWLLRPEVDAGLGLLEELDLAFDLVAVLPRHLELVPELVRRHPALRLVIDHLSKPPIGLSSRQPWWELIARAADHPNVFGKVSGLYSAVAVPTAGLPAPEAIRPFFARALEVFGVDRLMYGGDWPMSIPWGGYDAVWGGLSPLFDDLDSADRAAILGGTAARFYRLDASLMRRARDGSVGIKPE